MYEYVEAIVSLPQDVYKRQVETRELLSALAREFQPAAVIAVDALAARSLGRLGCTIQLSTSGISPGSGVNNARPQLSRETLGVPVVGIGVPTVVDAGTLAADLLGYAAPKDKVAPRGANTVSYTHLDVYKRQPLGFL